MTKLEFQTSVIYVIVEVENPKSRGEIYGVILNEYGKKVADKCIAMYDKHDYLID